MELIVVVGIISLVLAMTLPALSSMWSQRREAEVLTTLRGVLSSTRTQAMAGGERGLFFCLIDDVQTVFPIEREPPNIALNPLTDPGVTESDAQDRFRVVEGLRRTFPDPIRIVPRNVVDDTGNDYDEWTDDELKEEDYRAGGNEPQRHRNFFTLIFSADGRLVPGRSVLIHDPNLLPLLPPPDTFGDRTGLDVDLALTYFDPMGMPAPPMAGPGLADIVVDSNGDGINFVSVDGLLVYDESLFAELAPMDDGGALRKDLIIRTGRPMYVARLTGDVIIGPVGENEAPQ